VSITNIVGAVTAAGRAGTALVRRLWAEEVESAYQERTRAVERYREAGQRWDVERPQLAAAAEAERQNVRAAEAAVQDAAEQLRAALIQEGAARAAYEREVTQFRRAMHETVPPEVDTLHAELRAALQETQLAANDAFVQPTEMKRNMGGTGQRRALQVWGNLPSFDRRMGALREALRLVEDMKLEAIPPAELPQRIAAVRESIPPIVTESWTPTSPAAA
jgi:hypothetical protein